jgi:hypothetical protein
MRILFKTFLLSILLGAAAHVHAVNEGDTQTTRVTSCSATSNTCTSTTTSMVFMDGRWVVVSVSTIVVPYHRNNVEK